MLLSWKMRLLKNTFFNDSMHEEMKNLRNERDALKLENERLKNALRQSHLNSEIIKDDDTKSRFYTGLTWDVFKKLFEFTKPSQQRKAKFPLIDQLFLTLVKLRLNLPFFFLAQDGDLPDSTMRAYFWKWIDILYEKLDFLIQWPDPEGVRETLPGHFKEKYPRLTSIIDCFEIRIEQPSNALAKAQTYSNYKKANTVKVNQYFHCQLPFLQEYTIFLQYL